MENKLIEYSALNELKLIQDIADEINNGQNKINIKEEYELKYINYDFDEVYKKAIAFNCDVAYKNLVLSYSVHLHQLNELFKTAKKAGKIREALAITTAIKDAQIEVHALIQNVEL